MKDETKLNNYISAFSQQLSTRLVEGVDIKTIVHPVNQEGAVIEIVLEKGTGGGIEYQGATETVNDVRIYRLPLKTCRAGLVHYAIEYIFFFLMAFIVVTVLQLRNFYDYFEEVCTPVTTIGNNCNYYVFFRNSHKKPC